MDYYNNIKEVQNPYQDFIKGFVSHKIRTDLNREENQTVVKAIIEDCDKNGFSTIEMNCSFVAYEGKPNQMYFIADFMVKIPKVAIVDGKIVTFGIKIIKISATKKMDEFLDFIRERKDVEKVVLNQSNY